LVDKKVKKEIIARLEKGEQVNNLVERFGVSKSLIYEWKRELSERASCGYSKKDIYDHEQLRESLSNQVKVLQAVVNDNLSRAQICILIEKFKGEFQVATLCKAFELRKSSYYSYLRTGETMLENQDKLFSKRINEIALKHRRRIGAPKIRYLMKEEGFNIGVPRVRRLMKELGVMRATYTRPKYTYLRDTHDKPNILKREFQQSRRNVVWVGDITYLPTIKKMYYLAVVIDLFSRKVVGYCLDDRMTSAITEKALIMAYDQRDTCPEIFHSDQGSQYRSTTYKYLLSSNGVQQSFSKAGSPCDNAVAESFFASLKKELVITKGTITPTYRDLRKLIVEYIEYYNVERPHKTLNYRTPDYIDSLI